MKIPYQLVSMAAILRDWFDDLEYKTIDHEYLTGIADYLYNVDGDVEELLPEYKKVYDKYGPDYFAKVIRDMEALDGQVTNSRKANELLADYLNRVDSGVYASTKIRASLRTAGISTIATLGFINNSNGSFDICVVSTPYADMALATYDPDNDEFDVLESVKDMHEAYSRANALFKNQPEFEMFQKIQYVGASKRIVANNSDMTTNMQVYELRDRYLEKHPDGHFFDKETLKFFGERWSDMRVSRKLVEVKDYRGNPHICYELISKQRNAPGGTHTAYHYFDKDTFDQIDSI